MNNHINQLHAKQSQGASPILGVLTALAVHNIIPNSSLHPASKTSYYNILLLILLGLAALFLTLSSFETARIYSRNKIELLSHRRR